MFSFYFSLDIKLPSNPTSVIHLGITSSMNFKETKCGSFTAQINKGILTPSSMAAPEKTFLTQEMKTSDIAVVGDADQYQDSRLSEKSDDNPDDSDSSTPHQVDNDDDNSLASLQLPAADEAADDPSLANSSVAHQYYNTRKGIRSNAYYNDTAVPTQEEDKITVDPNDYESMYSIKRDLDMLRESSSEVSQKINELGTKEKKKGKDEIHR